MYGPKVFLAALAAAVLSLATPSNTSSPTTAGPSASPTTVGPSTSPTSANPTSVSPSASPTSGSPSSSPTSASPTLPTTVGPSASPTSTSPSSSPTSASPTTGAPTAAPTATPTSGNTSDCVDDASGGVKAKNYTCQTLLNLVSSAFGATCESDMSTLPGSTASPGTIFKDVCPVTCNNCPTTPGENTTSPTAPTMAPTSAPTRASTCEKLNETSTCFGVLGYDYVAIKGDTCQLDQEYELRNLPVFLGMLNNTACRQATYEVACASFYPQCEENETNPPTRLPCKNMTDNFATVCKGQNATLNTMFGNQLKTSPGPEGQCNKARFQQGFEIKVPTCEPYVGQHCAALLANKSIFVPEWYKQSDIEELIGPIIRGLVLAPSQCAPVMLNYVCTNAFTACSKNAIPSAYASLVAPFPNYPPLPELGCRTLCEEFQTECGAFLNKTGFRTQYPDCVNARKASKWRCAGEVEGSDSFPIVNSTLGSISGVPVITQCNPGHLQRKENKLGLKTTEILKNGSSLDMSALLVCPLPLVNPEDPLSPRLYDGSCSTPCPSLAFSENDWTHAENLQAVMTIFGFICNAFMITTWTFFEQKRRQEKLLAFISAVFLLNIGQLMALNGNARSNGCRNNAEPSSEGFCAFQGAWYAFFMLIATNWWFVQGMDLYVKVVLQYKIPTNSVVAKRKLIIERCWGFGYPLFVLVVGVALGSYGSGGGAPWCFYNDKSNVHMWIFSLIPVGIQGFLGTVMMVQLMYRMLQSMKKVKANAQSSKNLGSASAGKKGAINSVKTDAKMLKRLTRPMWFVGAFLLIFIYIFAYNIQNASNGASYMESGKEFIQCLIVKGEGMCGDRPEVAPSLFLWFGLNAVVNAQGFIVFLIYGTLPDNFRLWRKFIGGDFHAREASSTGASRTNPNSPGSTLRKNPTLSSASASSADSGVEMATNSPGSPRG